MKFLNVVIPAVVAASAVMASPETPSNDLVARDLVFEDVKFSFGRRDNAPEHERALAKRCASHKKHKKHTTHHKTTKKHKKTAKKPKTTKKTSKGSKDNFKPISQWKPTDFTWYTGHDLKNPSCWEQSVWTPTDEAMIAATTLEGWKNAPKCGSFVKICSEKKGSGKCTYVRTVDSCAGCEDGSSHLDLSKAAFTKMKELDIGEFIGSFAVMPDGFVPEGGWKENLYGPKKVDISI